MKIINSKIKTYLAGSALVIAIMISFSDQIFAKGRSDPIALSSSIVSANVENYVCDTKSKDSPCTFVVVVDGFKYRLETEERTEFARRIRNSNEKGTTFSDQIIIENADIINQIKERQGSNFISGIWHPVCGNTHDFNAELISTDSTSTGGGCTTGSYYCETFRQCIPSGEQCNTANPNYVPQEEEVNKNIPARIGPVSFNSPALVPLPPIGNPGYTCRVAWNNAFASYDTTTTCTFTGPNVNLSFMPSSTTSPTFYDATNIKTDTSFKMTCKDGDTGTPKETTTICRLNWDYKEVN